LRTRQLLWIIPILLIAFYQVASSQTITVTGAGRVSCNGVYYENGTYNGRPIYDKPGLGGAIRYWNSVGWVISPSGGTSIYYYVKNNTAGVPGDYPPDGLWSIENDAIGAPPAPSSVYDAALPVELSRFSAEVAQNGVLLKWSTESETNNLGFILERNVGADHDPPSEVGMGWQTIASYQTNPDLQSQGNTSSSTDYSFIDGNTKLGWTYSYRLSDVSRTGTAHVTDAIQIALPDAPKETVLAPPFPNPFNPQTKISYQLAESGLVTITVYDILGRKVMALLNEEQRAGSYSFHWLGQDDAGRQAASGTYILRLITGEVVQSQKVLLMR